VLLGILAAYCAVCTVQYLSPDTHGFLFGPLLARGGTFDNWGGRGITGPCQEPSFLAVNCVLFYLIAHRFYILNFISVNRLGVFFIFCFAMSLASFSGTGAITGTLMLGHYAYLKTGGIIRASLVLLVAAIPFFFQPLTSSGTNVRSVALLSEAASDPVGVLLADASMAFRISSIYAGVISAKLFPLGTGRLEYDQAVISKFTSSSYSAAMPQESYDFFLDGLITGGTNDIGTSLGKMGVLFVPIFILMLSLARPAVNGLFPIAVIIVALGTSAPLSHPLIWCYLGLASCFSGIKANAFIHHASEIRLSHALLPTLPEQKKISAC